MCESLFVVVAQGQPESSEQFQTKWMMNSLY